MVAKEETVSGKTARSGPRIQFSLATLMLLATLVSVFCAMTAWLGPVMLIVPMLAAGPVGGAIILRIRKSTNDANVVWWSGGITVVLWWALAAGIVYIATAILSANGRVTDGERVTYFLFAALVASPSAFAFGMVTGVIWVTVVRVAKEARKSMVGRDGIGSPSEGE